MRLYRNERKNDRERKRGKKPRQGQKKELHYGRKGDEMNDRNTQKNKKGWRLPF
jgi:hypothetical protein